MQIYYCHKEIMFFTFYSLGKMPYPGWVVDVLLLLLWLIVVICSFLSFIKNLDMMTYLAIIDTRYPTTLAICFLKEIQNEFSGKFDAREIAKMRRPYSCIEFSKLIFNCLWPAF